MMNAKLLVALYVALIVGMFVLFFANFPVAWILFIFLFVTLWVGLAQQNRPALVGLMFLLPGLLVLGFGLFGLQQSRQLSAWPTTSGIITRSWDCTVRTNGSVRYSGPCITYNYTVGEQTFTVKTQDNHELDEYMWFDIPAAYRQDRKVVVHYDPQNHGVSRLVVDIAPRDWITMAIGGLLAALAVVALVIVLLTGGQKPAPAAVISSKTTAAHPRRSHPRPAAPKPATPDISDQLEKLADLHHRHELTDAEYEAAKKALLGEFAETQEIP